MDYETITTEAGLASLCARLTGAPVIAIDTEFVSEDTYFPQLCLLQVAAPGVLAVVDTVVLPAIEPFWTLLAEGGHTTIVHAGRQELLFALESVERAPARLFDTQIAAGLVGYDYPAGHTALVQRVTGKRPPSGETRTDWRRRPLTSGQIEYALGDVIHLAEMYESLCQQLGELGRLTWLDAEMSAWQADIEDSRVRKRWRKVSGISGLSRRTLAIVRELWHWRDEQARSRNIPAKRILRDDLIIELAKRGTDDPKRLAAIRGFENAGLRKHVPALADAIGRGLRAGQEELPEPQRREDYPAQLNVLGQFLTTAVTCVCRRNRLAPALVGTASDVRDLVALRLGFEEESPAEPPRLSVGWRAEIVGKTVDDLLAGRMTIRIQDPLAQDPLTFDPAPTDN